MTDYSEYIHYNKNDVYNIIRGEILDLTIKPGQIISENVLAKRFSLSRTSIRAAISRLQSDKLVTVVPQKGTYATLINYELVHQIIYMRTQVETAINLELAALQDQRVFDRLEENLKNQEHVLKAADKHLFDGLNTQFHFMCYSAVKKDLLFPLVQNMQASYIRHRMLDYSLPQSVEIRFMEHRSLLEFFKRNDRAGIADLTARHLSITEHMLHIYKEHPEYFEKSVG